MEQPVAAEVNPTTVPDALAPPGDSAAASAPQPHGNPTDAPSTDWASLASLYQREASAMGACPAAAVLLHEAGRLHEERLRDAAGALARYREASSIDPASQAHAEAARRAARALGDVELECELLEAQAAAARDPRDAATLRLERARLLELRLGRVEEARDALAAAERADPQSLPVAEHQAALATAQGRHEDLAAALERCAALAGDPQLAAAWLACASAVEEDRLGRLDRATDLALRAFELAPGDASVRARARRHAERERRFEALAAVLAADAAAEETTREAALLSCELARLQAERLDAPAQARATLEQARRLAEDDPLVLDALAQAYEAMGDWEAAAEALRARTAAHLRAGSENPAELIAGNLRLAELCGERLGRIDEAAACYRAVLSVDPRHRGALAALGRIYAAAGDWDQLLATFIAERKAAVDHVERAQRCFKAAEVMEERLGRPAGAIELYAEALTLDPSLLAAHQALERLYESEARYPELAALLEADLQATRDREERISILFRLARLHEDRLGDLGAASRACQRILELAPDHAAALRELAGLHERAGRFGDLVTVHERLVELTADARKAIALLQRTAEVQEEQLGDEAAAAATYKRILALDATYLPALRGLGRLHGRAGRFDELVAMFRAEAEASPSTEIAADLFFRMGEALERRLDRPGEAVAAYRKSLALAASHGGALRGLARLHRRDEDWESLIDVLRTEAAAQASVERRAALLAEVADLCEKRLSDPDRAAEVHEEVLRELPGFAPSLRALDRVLSARGRWSELARLLAAGAQRAQGPAQVELLLRVAGLRLDRLGDPAGAEQACRAALAESPADPAALLLLARCGAPRAEAREGLAARLAEPAAAAQLLVGAARDRLSHGEDPGPAVRRAGQLTPSCPATAPLVEEELRRSGSPADLAAHLAARCEAAVDPEAKAPLALRAAEAWEEAGDLERALTACRDSLRLSPGTLPALETLRRLHVRAEAWRDARDALRQQADALRHPSAAAAAYAEAGEIALTRLGDPAGAADDWRRGLARDPRDRALGERLAALLQASGDAGSLCELREVQAAAELDLAASAAAWSDAARLALELGDRERALRDLERSLTAQPGCAPALLLRGRVLRELGRHEEAARELLACLKLGDGDGVAAPAHLELAALYQGPLGDAPRAMSHLNAALAASPENEIALARLARLHSEARNWPGAADALRRLVVLPGVAPAALRDHLLELASVREVGFADPVAAAELCERALQVAPSDAAAQERMARLRGRGGGVPGVVSALQAATAAAPSGPERARAHVRAARVLSEILDDKPRAVEELRRALEVDPGDAQARSVLAGLYAATDPALAVEEHRRFLTEDPARIESWRALYGIFRSVKANDRAFVAAGVLRFLGAADPDEVGAFYARNAPQVPSGTPQRLAPSEWLALRHPLDRGPLSDLLSLVGNVLWSVADLRPPHRERPKTPHPLSSLAMELCGNLGLDPFPLRRAGDDDQLEVEPGQPPTVRVGAELLRRCSVPEQRFLVARAAARVRAQSGVAQHVSPSQLGELVAAAVRQVVPGFDGTGRPADVLVKKVGRAIPRKWRKALEERARAVARAGPLDIAAWQASLAATADRVGLLLSTDVPAALAAVLRQGTPAAASPADVAAAVRAREDLRQLLLFAGSDEHFRLRQRLKLAVS